MLLPIGGSEIVTLPIVSYPALGGRSWNDHEPTLPSLHIAFLEPCLWKVSGSIHPGVFRALRGVSETKKS